MEHFYFLITTQARCDNVTMLQSSQEMDRARVVISQWSQWSADQVENEDEILVELYQIITILIIYIVIKVKLLVALKSNSEPETRQCTDSERAALIPYTRIVISSRLIKGFFSALSNFYVCNIIYI